MSQPSFDSIGPFATDMSWSARADAVRDLAKACERHRSEAQEAMRLLGDPQNSARRADALTILNALPSLAIRDILARLLIIQARKRRLTRET